MQEIIAACSTPTDRRQLGEGVLKSDLDGDGEVTEKDKVLFNAKWGPKEEAAATLPALPACCKEMTAECVACAKETTVEIVCTAQPNLAGCEGATPVVCDLAVQKAALRKYMSKELITDQDDDGRLTDRDAQKMNERCGNTDATSLMADLNGDGVVNKCDKQLMRMIMGVKAAATPKPVMVVKDKDGASRVTVDADTDPRKSKAGIELMDKKGKKRVELGEKVEIRDKTEKPRLSLGSDEKDEKEAEATDEAVPSIRVKDDSGDVRMNIAAESKEVEDMRLAKKPAGDTSSKGGLIKMLEKGKPRMELGTKLVVKDANEKVRMEIETEEPEEKLSEAETDSLAGSLDKLDDEADNTSADLNKDGKVKPP